MGTYRIVVGVDGSDGGRRALRWAVRQASARNATVQAVIAYRFDDVADAAVGLDAQRRRAEEVLARDIETVPPGWRSGVTIAGTAAEGRAPDVLTQAARDADLLVVGSHGHGRAWHIAVGSVSEACISQSTCPVVVVPSRDAG